MTQYLLELETCLPIFVQSLDVDFERTARYFDSERTFRPDWQEIYSILQCGYVATKSYNENWILFFNDEMFYDLELQKTNVHRLMNQLGENPSDEFAKNNQDFFGKILAIKLPKSYQEIFN